MQINLNLTLDQTNIILENLKKQPFEVVGALIPAILQQTTAQIQATQDQEKERQEKELLAQVLYKMELAKDQSPKVPDSMTGANPGATL